MKFFISTYLLFFSVFIFSQDDETVIKNIFDTTMTTSSSYELLDFLSNEIGHRLSGSLGAERAVEWGRSELSKIGFDKVWLQEVMVPKWVRGIPEFAYIETKPGNTIKVNICALGGSISTPSTGLKAKIVEVSGVEELEKLGRDKIKDKIVFFNRPMDASLINTFES